MLILNCKAFGVSRVNPAWGDVCCLLNCKVFGKSTVNPTWEMCVVCLIVGSSAGVGLLTLLGEMCVVY